MAESIRVKRIYDPPARTDGARVLVDRLWPRGVAKAEARLTLWAKDVAPSAELRAWFGHNPDRWAEFERRYRAELQAKPDAVAEVRDAADGRPITLLYAARDTARNNAVVLAEYLASAAARSGTSSRAANRKK